MAATLADKKRAYYSEALGLANTGNISMTDLENKFFSTASGAGGAYRYGFTAKNLPKWQKALARVRDNVGDAKIMALGDSQFFGVGSTLWTTFPCTGSPMARMQALFAERGLSSSHGFITPGSDQRWTVAGNWTVTLFGIGSLAAYTSAVSAGTLVCTDTRTTWDRCDVYYMQGPGLGTIACTATGGSTVNAVGANAASTVQKVTCSAATPATSNTISMVPTVAQCYIVGVDFFLNGVSKIRIGNGGVGTVGVQQHVTPSQFTTWGTVPVCTAYAPDLTIIGLGVNDRGASRTTAQFQADMVTLITALKAMGSDVIIASEMPAQSAPNSTNEGAYNTAMSELATTYSAPYYAYCERCQSFATYNSGGFAFDGLHQNNLGYWDWAQGIVPQLVGI
jgi:hypothetical protein